MLHPKYSEDEVNAFAILAKECVENLQLSYLAVLVERLTTNSDNTDVNPLLTHEFHLPHKSVTLTKAFDKLIKAHAESGNIGELKCVCEEAYGREPNQEEWYWVIKGILCRSSEARRLFNAILEGGLIKETPELERLIKLVNRLPRPPVISPHRMDRTY